MISLSDHYNALIIETKIGNDLWHFNSSFLRKEDFCSATKHMLSILSTKKSNYSSPSVWWEYTKSQIKDNARLFAKNSTKQENIRISRLKKRLRNLYKKENFKPEIKPMIQNLQDKLYTLESKQAKGTKILANIKWDLEGEKCSKTFFNVLERQNMQNQTVAELYIDNKRLNILAITKTFLSLLKIFMKIFTLEEIYPEML